MERTQKHLLETGRPLPPKNSFKLRDLVLMFLGVREDGNPHTVDTDRNNLAAVPKTLPARPLAFVHASDTRAHLLSELRAGKMPLTVARSKTTLSDLFTYALENGMLHQPHPVRAMKKILELGTVAQRAVRAKDIPSPDRLAAESSGSAQSEQASPTCSSSWP